MNGKIEIATIEDLPGILDLQKRAFLAVAQLIGNRQIEPMTQTLTELAREHAQGTILKYCTDGRIVGSVRYRSEEGGGCYVGRLVVDPACQGHGIGKALMQEVEQRTGDCRPLRLFTGSITPHTVRLYRSLGYREVRREPIGDDFLVYMEK